ncbi:unnamed protein product [Colias eurytheme]|nr:unnamed protein product [Colias eurytheme]
MAGLKHCAYDGCLAKQGLDNLSFFSLPVDEKRRKLWLGIINRPDLDRPDIKPRSYAICSRHFEPSSIVFVPKLKADAIPSRSAQGVQTCDQYTQTPNPSTHTWITPKVEPDYYYSSCIQREFTQKEIYGDLCKSTQTTVALADTLNTPSKRKLTQQLEEMRLKKLKIQSDFSKYKKGVPRKDSNKEKRFIIKTEDEVTKRFCKLIEWQNKMKKHANGNRFDIEFKLFALNLHYASPQTYRCLKTFLHLPSETTLARFKITISPKFNDRVINFLSAKLKSLPKPAKYCTLSIYEMDLKRHLHYDSKRDEIIGLRNINGQVNEEVASHACILMLRGIFVNWNQPIAYSFVTSANNYKDFESWLEQVISKLFNIGIDIRAIISHKDSNFNRYAEYIKQITSEKPYYFINDKKIYCIFDVPHLMKSIRNNLLVNDLKVDDKTISWKYVQYLYCQDKEMELQMIPKVTEKHLHPSNVEKRRVKYAVQIFSLSVYAAFNKLILDRILPECARATADFIKQLNDVFDVLNSSKKQAKYKYKNSFSFKNYQVDALNEALKTFNKIIETTGNNTSEIETFKNMTISIQSILMLATDLKNEGFKSLHTRRLNQDCFVKFFNAIRRQGETCRNPTPIEFQKSFSKLFLSDMLKNSRACQEDIICDFLQKGNTFHEETNQTETDIPTSLVSIIDTDYRFDVPKEGALTYVSGFLLCKCAKKHSCPTLASELEKIPDLNTSSMFTHFKEYNKGASFYDALKVPPDTFNIYVMNLEAAFLEHFKPKMERPGSKLYEILHKVQRAKKALTLLASMYPSFDK